MAFARTVINTTGNTTSGSTTISGVASTVGIFNGMNIYGTGIPADTQVSSFTANSITMSKSANANGTGVAITGQYITQSGTDTDPSGLSAMGGVTTITQGTGNPRRTVYDLGLNQLLITGTITHDPDLFELIFNVQNSLYLNSGANYSFGVKRTINGQDSYSKGSGLVFTYSGAIASQFGFTQNAGTFTWNGGIIKSACPPVINAGVWVSNSFNCIWQNSNTGTDYQLRFVSSAPTINALTLSGFSFAPLLFLNGGFNKLTAKYEFGAYQTPGGGGTNRTILNSVYTGNQSTADVRINQLGGTQQVTTIKNADRIPVVNRLNNNAKGDLPVVETLTLNITDTNNANAQNVVSYIKDSNNGSRQDSTVTNYVNDRTYLAVSNSSGVASMGDILICSINDKSGDPLLMNYDYRGNFGATSIDFNVYLGGYEFIPSKTKQTLIGNGGKSVAWTMFNDLNVTLNRVDALAKLASSFIVDPVTKKITVTSNATYDDVYDIAKAYKYQGTQTAVETPTVTDLIVNASGNRLIAYTGWTLQVNSGVTLNVGTKYNEVYFDTVTNNGTIVGTYADLTGTYAKILVNGLSSDMIVKVLETSSGNVLSSTIATGTSAYMGYYLPVGATSTTIDLYVEKAIGQANGYNLYKSTLTVGTSGATTTALMQIDTFYGRSSGQADRANVSVTWNSTTGAPTITLSGNADVKSVYDVVVESHATVANITYNRPTTSDGFTYQFNNAIFTGTGRLTGTKQFFTTGGVSINYDLILNYLNTVNFLPNSWIKVIKSSDNSVLSPFALNTQGKLELNMGTGVDYKVFLKKDGYKPVVVELNSGTGQAVTVNQPAQAYYNGATDISALTPLLDVTNNSGILSIVSVGEMTATSLEVCAIIDYLQKDEDFADVALYAETGDIWEINSQYQNTPNPTYIKIERDPALTNSELTIWDTYFTSSSPNYPDTAITPIQTSTGLWVISNRSAVGEVTIKNEQALAISENASEYVWQKVLENGKTANKNVSQSNNFDAITSIEVQKTN